MFRPQMTRLQMAVLKYAVLKCSIPKCPILKCPSLNSHPQMSHPQVLVLNCRHAYHPMVRWVVLPTIRVVPPFRPLVEIGETIFMKKKSLEVS